MAIKPRNNGKHPGGRTPKYDPEKYPNMVYIACREGGMTDPQLAKLFDVDRATIKRWKNDYPEFCAAQRKGKDEYNTANAEQALKKRVEGFCFNEVTKEPGEDGKLKVAKIVRKFIPPDPTSMIFFLKNRDSGRWRDKQEVEHSGGVEIKEIKIKLVDA